MFFDRLSTCRLSKVSSLCCQLTFLSSTRSHSVSGPSWRGRFRLRRAKPRCKGQDNQLVGRDRERGTDGDMHTTHLPLGGCCVGKGQRATEDGRQAHGKRFHWENPIFRVSHPRTLVFVHHTCLLIVNFVTFEEIIDLLGRLSQMLL